MDLHTIYMTVSSGALNEVIVSGSRQTAFQRNAGGLVVSVSGNSLLKQPPIQLMFSKNYRVLKWAATAHC